MLTKCKASLSQSTTTDETPAPPITRSATDSISVKIKRERDEDNPIKPPRKNPRRTLSEQIVITKFQDSVLSPRSPLVPRSPAPERVNKALNDRIEHLKDENSDLKEQVNTVESEKDEVLRRWGRDIRKSEQMRKDLADVMARVSNLESEVASLRSNGEKNDKRHKG
jgi:predicted RNase H-like nuclease (RuvC/YqgF family)